MINKLLTKKEIAYSVNDVELEQILLSGKLPYLPAENDNDIHRPANLKLMKISDNSILNTHEMPIKQLMSYGNEISDAINETSPDTIAFEIAKSQKNIVVSLANIIVTYGDLMQMLNDEYLYRKFNYEKAEFERLYNN